MSTGPQTIRLALPNAIAMLLDRECEELPDWEGGGAVHGTPTCVYLGGRPDMDGETIFVFGRLQELAEVGEPAYVGMISTPSRELVLLSSQNEILLAQPVVGAETEVRIWVDHPREPDRVVIGIV